MKEIEKHIVNYLNGDLDKNTLAEFKNWLTKTKNQKYFHEYIIANHLIELYNKIFDHKKGYISFKHKTDRPKLIRFNFTKKYRTVLKYAAILIPVLGSAYFFTDRKTSRQTVQIYVPKGEHRVIHLHDGTKVALNSNSTFTYPSSFSNKTRVVYLKGEAFFDVVKNPERPFIVKLPSEMKVKVLGTSFNIKAYPEDTKTVTSLFTGKVELIYKNKVEIRNMLYPGYKANFQKSIKKMTITQENAIEEAISWKKGTLLFKKETLNNIINELNRFYNTEIEITDQELNNIIYTASFKKGTELKDVMKYLEITGNLEFVKISKNKWNLLTQKHKRPMKKTN